ncbi:MAG: ATP-binding cassette domain-containing protein, partial [Anaerolineales bacterium]
MAQETITKNTPGENLVEVKHLVKYFPVTEGVLRRKVADVKAVDDVSFTVKEGETLSLVGESGCGKTTAAQTMLRLIEPTSGEVLFKGENVFAARGDELKKIRRHMQIVFQDPY